MGKWNPRSSNVVCDWKGWSPCPTAGTCGHETSLPILSCSLPHISEKNVFGKIQRGAHKRGLKPQIFRENRGEILPGKLGLFGANWRHFRAGRGLFGADRDQFLCTPQPRGKSRNCPERALFGPIGPFRAKPPFAKPPFGFPRKILVSVKMFARNSGTGNGRANFMGAWKKAFFLQENLHAHKIPRFRGGGVGGFRGGGVKCRFYFYGREDFSEHLVVQKEPSRHIQYS